MCRFIMKRLNKPQVCNRCQVKEIITGDYLSISNPVIILIHYLKLKLSSWFSEQVERTETNLLSERSSKSLEISDTSSACIMLSEQLMIMMLIRLRGCRGCIAFLLFRCRPRSNFKFFVHSDDIANLVTVSLLNALVTIIRFVLEPIGFACVTPPIHLSSYCNQYISSRNHD